MGGGGGGVEILVPPPCRLRSEGLWIGAALRCQSLSACVQRCSSFIDSRVRRRICKIFVQNRRCERPAGCANAMPVESSTFAADCFPLGQAPSSGRSGGGGGRWFFAANHALLRTYIYIHSAFGCGRMARYTSRHAARSAGERGHISAAVTDSPRVTQ